MDHLSAEPLSGGLIPLHTLQSSLGFSTSDWVLLVSAHSQLTIKQPEVLTPWTEMPRCELWLQHLGHDVTSWPA